MADERRSLKRPRPEDLAQKDREIILRMLEAGDTGWYQRLNRAVKWDGPFGLTHAEMAELLGITLNRFRYLGNRKWKGQIVKRRQADARAAAKIPLLSIVCREVKCTVFVPEGWAVIDKGACEDDTRQRELTALLRRGPAKVPEDQGWVYFENGRSRSPTEVENRIKAKEEYDARVAKARGWARVERMSVAWVDIGTVNNIENLEACYLRLDEELTAT